MVVSACAGQAAHADRISPVQNPCQAVGNHSGAADELAVAGGAEEVLD